MSAPGWQTEELQDEWVDLEPTDGDGSGEETDQSFGTHSLSLTSPLASHILTNIDHAAQNTSSHSSNYAAGTFLIREDVPDAPFVPKTPGRKKGLGKDIFTPLPLERMFEPPSPPETGPLISNPAENHPCYIPGRGQDADTNVAEVVPSKHSSSLACRFTFTMPKSLTIARSTFSDPESTPTPPVVFQRRPPATDSRLRLFQFKYDTYTREHLSAMVDSITANNASVTGTTPSPSTFTHRLSRVSEFTDSASVADVSHLRSAKRVKLSPVSDYYGEGAGSQAVISRPPLFGKDYLGESKQLMQQIKLARDFSTISTSVSTSNSASLGSQVGAHVMQEPRALFHPELSPHYFGVPSDESGGPLTSSKSAGSRQSQYSSSSYRKQAEALMAAIKQDVKQKRVVSGGTDPSLMNSGGDNRNIISPNPPPDGMVPNLWSGSLNREMNRIKVSPPVSRKPSSSRTSHRRTDPQAPVVNRGASHINPHELARALSQVSLTARPLSNPSVDGVIQERPALMSLVPPSFPSTSARVGAAEDMNRFVSSSTAAGTAVTSGSAPSFVKHPGPAHIRTIAPQDIPSLPDRFGDMIFDKVNSRWIRNAAGDIAEVVDESSDDPFIDIESLRDESRGEMDEHRDVNASEQSEDETARQGLYSVTNEMNRTEERSEVDDEEVDLMSFSTDTSSRVVSVMTGVDPNAIEEDTSTTDSEDNLELVQHDARPLEFDSEDDDLHIDVPKVVIAQETDLALPSNPNPPSIPPSLVTPHHSDGIALMTPAVRSVLRSNGATTPTSVLKDPSRSKYQTPVEQKNQRRSVSFSDGRRDGPILGLHDSSESFTVPFSSNESNAEIKVTCEIVPSARSKRIEEMMDALQDSESNGHSPSKRSSLGTQEFHALQPNEFDSAPQAGFSRSQGYLTVSSKENLGRANGTFLTECSFGVAHDRLVTVITDVQPFEPHWEQLTSINLSKKNLESVARLKEFLPRLDSLSLNSNRLSWLSGIPESVRTLSVALNSLTGLTSFAHLSNIESLDISRNDVDSLRQLESLRHLRELKVDYNKIVDLDGLQNMDGLVKLSVQGNLIQSVDLNKFKWKRLEMINISQNRLESITGVEMLLSLVALNLDNNCLRTLEVDGSLPRLRILRLSGNRLRQVDVGGFTNLRTLYADNNSLTHLVKLNRLTKLENLSLRNQSGRGLNLLTRDVRDVKRLYLSGNPLQPTFISEACYNMIYLEVAACRLTALPEDMAKLTPNLRVLNLNYNFLEDARPLEGLTRLEKLTIIGSRLQKTKPLIRLVQRMPDIEMLDFRMNPCTLGWYLPLLVKDVPGALQPSESKGSTRGRGKRGNDGEGKESNSWQELDAKFRRDLPDELYIGRLAYRGLVMRACRRIRMLDGVGVSEKEETKAQKLLVGILNKTKSKDKTTGKDRGTEGSIS